MDFGSTRWASGRSDSSRLVGSSTRWTPLVLAIWEYSPMWDYGKRCPHVHAFFYWDLLCSDLGSTVNLHFLGSLRKIEQIRNYDWGSMAYATLMHFMIQLSRWSLSSLGGAPFAWQVRFGIYFGCVECGKLFWFCGNDVVNFQVWMYEYFGVGLEIQEKVTGIFPRFLCWLPKHRLSIPS